ncbi:uncharacterized protein LOC128885760 [Hylaeus anthracinus]|uniref:uncharacterized protein LOC128885760 n=1 Tax=Hylaeus anthracinus TaxID=313031 RepID=UPI0023B9F1B9|nr:uncharacterized protein LOC128885760 [Hylaeus anthracinus]
MKKYATYTNLDKPGSSKDFNKNARSTIYPVKTIVNTRHDPTTDALEKLSLRIMCSGNITRQSLYKKPSTVTTSDDDDEFFLKLKSEIDKHLSSHSKENYKQNINYQDITLLQKKRPIIDKETQSVIKRFKKDAIHTNVMQTLSDKNNRQSNYVESALKKTNDTSTNTLSKSVQWENMFSSNILNSNFRDPTSKYIYQTSSKVQQNNVIPLPTNKVVVAHAEYEEFLFYGMTFLTPPNSNSSEDN